MSVRIPLGPMDSEGVRFDRPPSQVRWSEITNFIIHEGALLSRPGFEVDNRAGKKSIPNTVQPAPLVSLVQILNPGNTATGRETFSPAADMLVPNSDADLVAGWSGAFGDIDEGVPDAVAVMSTNTEGAQTNIGFTNPLLTHAAVQGVTFHIRARVTDNGVWAKVNFFQRPFITNFLITSQVVTTQASDSSDDWEDLYFTLDRNLADDTPLSDSDLDGLQLVIELDSAESFLWENLTAGGNGSHTEWEDAQDGGTADFVDCQGVTGLIVFDNSTLPTNRFIRSDTDGERQTFTFTTTETFATVAGVSCQGFVRKPNGKDGDSTCELIFVTSTGTIHSLVERNVPPGTPGRILASGTVTTNPDTGSAWTIAEIDNGEFGLRMGVGDELACGTISITVFGTTAGGTLQIDTVNAQVSGVTIGDPTSKTRLFSSNLSHLRYDEDTRAPTITDVTNSVPLDSSGPGWPVQNAVVYGQAFLVNGVDPTVFYPTGANVFGEMATNNSDGTTVLTGRTVAAFGDRLFYGWVLDNTTVTPERISYSRFRDASTHNHRSAGDFDLLDTPGGVVSLVPLDEQNMAALKEVGAYVIRRTGNDIFPFIRDVIDFDVSIIGARTAQRVQFPEGTAILFLGSTSTNGINVYMFDGKTVQPIGNSIARELRETMNHGNALLTSHAQVDPSTNTYWLFVPEGLRSFPRQAWIMNLSSKQWTRATFPWEVYSSGTWHFPDRTFLNGLSGATAYIGGRPKLVIGTGGQSFPCAANADIAHDETAHPVSSLGDGNERLWDPSEQGVRYEAFVPTLVTGDLVKPGDMEVVSYRIGMLFEARDPVNRVLIDVSEDGGQNYSTAQTHFFGPDDLTDVRAPVGGTYFAEWDMEPTHAPQVRYRLRFESEAIVFTGTTEISTDAPVLPQKLAIHDMWVTVESGADSE